MPERKKLLQVKHLKQYFTSGKSTVKAVDDVTFDIYEGETFGLVGESGSGKTTTGRSIIRLYDPTDGEIIFDGKDIIAEGIDIHGLAKSKKERSEMVENLLETVGLNRDHASRYPHEFSGGQRQRIGIARALAVQPKFIIADEPISALDVSIQAQV